MQKSLVFLYSSNEQSEKDTEKTIPFLIESKRLKCPKLNSTKEIKYMYNKFIKHCWNKLKIQINEKTFHIHGLENN